MRSLPCFLLIVARPSALQYSKLANAGQRFSSRTQMPSIDLLLVTVQRQRPHGPASFRPSIGKHANFWNLHTLMKKAFEITASGRGLYWYTRSLQATAHTRHLTHELKAII